ncbi:MAG: bifunctional demethylmenaquinone methyltransferase/2-methoxy-6-polyprenyl-1,4-benzoquinol methylase UbiE [Coriobacteriales bacterium]|jgi:demethylmenaquinone methyltransferase/2-methoxy-6-polyprenyl-1,4-benzoquinol methylase
MAKEHVHGVFQSIAPQYDAANDRISFGMHRIWKRDLVSFALRFTADSDPAKVLDVCCGTGDVTEQLCLGNPDSLVVGLDFSSEMLKVAEKRLSHAGNSMLIEGNAMELPFDDGTFDAAIISFGLRNTPDYKQVLSEMRRVVRPGGGVACLDASVPDNPLVFPFYNFYYKNVMTLLGGGSSKHAEYEWLYQSTQEFLRKTELAALFREVGLDDVRIVSYMFGASALHTGLVR